MKKIILIMLIAIGMMAFTSNSVKLPNTKSTNFTWENNSIEFHYLGSDELPKNLLDSLVIKTMNSINEECKDSIKHVPFRLTVNGDLNNLLTSIEYSVSEKCSPTLSLQTTIIFDVDGNVTNKFVTFN